MIPGLLLQLNNIMSVSKTSLQLLKLQTFEPWELPSMLRLFLEFFLEHVLFHLHHQVLTESPDPLNTASVNSFPIDFSIHFIFSGTKCTLHFRTQVAWFPYSELPGGDARHVTNLSNACHSWMDTCIYRNSLLPTPSVPCICKCSVAHPFFGRLSFTLFQ